MILQTSSSKAAKILSKLHFSVRFQLANIHYFTDDNSSGNYLAGGKWQSLKSVKIQGFMARLRRLERPTLRLGDGHTDFFLVPHRTIKHLESRYFSGFFGSRKIFSYHAILPNIAQFANIRLAFSLAFLN